MLPPARYSPDALNGELRELVDDAGRLALLLHFLVRDDRGRGRVGAHVKEHVVLDGAVEELASEHTVVQGN